jgi:hypothetical protein
LLGPLPGKKAQIAHCLSLQNDPTKHKALSEKVKEADKKGSTAGTSALSPLAKSFGTKGIHRYGSNQIFMCKWHSIQCVEEPSIFRNGYGN